MLNFPERLNLAQLPTPLVSLQRITAELRERSPHPVPTLWMKRDDLTGCLLSGNKIRKLEFVVAEAQARGADVLITCGGKQSNHCRATAAVAAQLGLDCHLLLRDDSEQQRRYLAENACVDTGNFLLDKVLGARVEVLPPDRYFSELNEIFEERQYAYLAEGKHAFLIPTGASDQWGLWGYVNACREILLDCTQLAVSPDALVCATGSGGTQAGLTLGMHLFSPSTRVYSYAVCDSTAYFAKKVCADVRDWLQQCRQRHYFADTSLLQLREDALHVHTNDAYIGLGYGIGYPEVFDTIGWLARREGVILDPIYTGKAFHGLVTDILEGRFADCDNVIFIHTGGTFGLFPYSHCFQ